MSIIRTRTRTNSIKITTKSISTMTTSNVEMEDDNNLSNHIHNNNNPSNDNNNDLSSSDDDMKESEGKLQKPKKRGLSSKSKEKVNKSQKIEVVTSTTKRSKASVSCNDNNNNNNNKSSWSAPRKCADGKIRCWSTAEDNSPMQIYHDKCWGRTSQSHPLTVLNRNSVEYKQILVNIFSILTYQTMQSGISWKIVFDKISNFQVAFDNFDLKKVSEYKESKIAELLQNSGIIRNELKIRAAVNNAQCILRAEKEFEGGFIELLYQDIYEGNYNEEERLITKGNRTGSYMRTDFDTKSNTIIQQDGVHPSLSVHRLANRLKKYGFKFCGETVVLCFMQAAGLMNHHTNDCFAYKECNDEFKKAVTLRIQHIPSSNSNHNKNTSSNKKKKDNSNTVSMAIDSKADHNSNSSNSNSQKPTKSKKTAKTQSKSAK